MARVHLINHLDKWHSGQNKVQNESHCDLVSTNLWYSAMEMFVTWDKQREPPGTKHIFTTEGAPRERLQWAQQSCRVFSELSRISLMLSFANSAVLFFSLFFFFLFCYFWCSECSDFFTSCRQSTLAQSPQQGVVLSDTDSPQLHGRATSEISHSSPSRVLAELNLWWSVNGHGKKTCGPATPPWNTWDLSTNLCALTCLHFSIPLILLQFLVFLLEVETCKNIFRVMDHECEYRWQYFGCK